MMSSYQIRLPEKSDLDGLISVHVQSWKDTYPNEAEGVSKDFVNEYMERFTNKSGREKRSQYITEAHENPNYFLRIAEDEEGTVIGFVDARKSDNDYELCGLYIDKLMYGKGLAHDLADIALDWLGRSNDVRLDVVSYNKRAQRFYEKLGFKTIVGSKRQYKNTPIYVVDMIRKAAT